MCDTTSGLISPNITSCKPLPCSLCNIHKVKESNKNVVPLQHTRDAGRLNSTQKFEIKRKASESSQQSFRVHGNRLVKLQIQRTQTQKPRVHLFSTSLQMLKSARQAARPDQHQCPTSLQMSLNAKHPHDLINTRITVFAKIILKNKSGLPGTYRRTILDSRRKQMSGWRRRLQPIGHSDCVARKNNV